MSLEGHFCWENCDEGPHGCICGNDCPPPAPRAWDDAKIREAFIYDAGESEYHDPIAGARTHRQVAGDIFDRWMREHDAKVLEAAADEWHEPHDPTTYSASEWLGSRAAAIREGQV